MSIRSRPAGVISVQSPGGAALSIDSPNATFPLAVSANSRYLETPGGTPFYMIGDSPYSLFVDLAPTDNATSTDLGAYLSTRQSQGFNTVRSVIVSDDQTGGRSDGSTFDGITPFTGTVGGSPDVTTPRSTYWARMDTMVQMISDYGFLLLLGQLETQGWLDVMLANGSTRCNTYGQFIANRYASFDNIIWVSGNDYQTPSSTNDAVVQAVANGIRTAQPGDLQTVQLFFLNSDSFSDYPFGNGPSTWPPLIDINTVYSYNQQYGYFRDAYNHGSPDGPMPGYLIEASYEHEQNSGAPLGDPHEIRRQFYWALTNGMTGNCYGEQHVWPLLTGFEDYLLPANSPGVTSITKFAAFVQTVAWETLVPDQSNTFLISGQGTDGADNYCTAAKDSGGHLGLVYIPFSTNVHMDCTQMAGAVTGTWFDPVSGSTSSAGSGLTSSNQTFTHPGNNSGGDADWVLKLTA